MECEYDPDQCNISQQNLMDAEQSETSFTDLNDHCLLKVFGYLNLLDMINIRRTCKRLNVVSQMAAKDFKIFCMRKYSDEVIVRENQLPTAWHVDRAMQFIAPIVESIKTSHHIYAELESLQTLEKYDFPKLRLLSVNKADQLRWIKNKGVEILTISYLERGDLNNHAFDITNVKHLTLNDISTCVPISELLYFFENNPNIERLQFMAEIQRKIPTNFFRQLKNLKMLEFTMGHNHGDLLCALQIENLNELILKYQPERRTINLINMVNNTTERFLTSMAEKQTLKSIDIRMLYFDELVDTLAPLNLVSLRYVTPLLDNTHFYSQLATTPFPTLKHFDILASVDIPSFFALIQHLTALEEVRFTLIKPYDKQTFLEYLSRLLSVRKPNRPELKIGFLIRSLKVKVSGI